MNRDIMGKAVLVTGGAGFIGSHLVDRLIDSGVEKVFIIDNMFLGNEKNLSNALNKGAVLYKDDAEIYSTLEYIIKENQISIVFNCATKALNYSFVNPSNAYMTNVNIMVNLLELQRKGLFKTLCHFSTSEVYGTALYTPMDEKHPVDPTTTYAAGKAAADIMLGSYVKMYDLDAFIVRPFNNYGPRQNYEGKLAGVIPITISKILSGQMPEIHGKGLQKRDFIYVEDTADAVLKLYPVLSPGDTVNISANGMIEIKDLIHKITKIMNYEGQILYKDRRVSDVDCHNASNKKFLSIVPFDFTPLEEGLKKTVEWYNNHLQKR
ncbi:MAG: NAD-dependent epimerase/dehydratase family protein [Eubacteriales bacterium]|nr:NAD-dependent epimerase/dehydratase family protein [Eubacteriales bacterium]